MSLSNPFNPILVCFFRPSTNILEQPGPRKSSLYSRHSRVFPSQSFKLTRQDTLPEDSRVSRLRNLQHCVPKTHGRCGVNPEKARMGSRMGSTRGKENFRHPDNYGETKKMMCLGTCRSYTSGVRSRNPLAHVWWFHFSSG